MSSLHGIFYNGVKILGFFLLPEFMNFEEFLVLTFESQLSTQKKYFTNSKTYGLGFASWISKESFVNVIFKPLSKNEFDKFFGHTLFTNFKHQINYFFEKFLRFANGSILFLGNVNFFGVRLPQSSFDLSEPPSIFAFNSQYNNYKSNSQNYLIIGSAFGPTKSDIYICFKKDNFKSIFLVNFVKDKNPEELISFESLDLIFMYLKDFYCKNFDFYGKLKSLGFGPVKNRISLV
jgi:hypothetical protein